MTNVPISRGKCVVELVLDSRPGPNGILLGLDSSGISFILGFSDIGSE